MDKSDFMHFKNTVLTFFLDYRESMLQFSSEKLFSRSGLIFAVFIVR